MTITKALVDAMGGTIDVASGEGRGTTFTVQLKFKLGVPDGEACAPAAGDEGGSHANALFNGLNNDVESDSGSKPCQCGGVLQEASEGGKRNKNEAVAGEPGSAGDARDDADATNNKPEGKGKRLSFAEVFEGRRYLVAEDNQINRIILTELLTERGAQLDEAENGRKPSRCSPTASRTATMPC